MGTTASPASASTSSSLAEQQRSIFAGVRFILLNCTSWPSERARKPAPWSPRVVHLPGSSSRSSNHCAARNPVAEHQCEIEKLHHVTRSTTLPRPPIPVAKSPSVQQTGSFRDPPSTE